MWPARLLLPHLIVKLLLVAVIMLATSACRFDGSGVEPARSDGGSWIEATEVTQTSNVTGLVRPGGKPGAEEEGDKVGSGREHDDEEHEEEGGGDKKHD